MLNSTVDLSTSNAHCEQKGGDTMAEYSTIPVEQAVITGLLEILAEEHITLTPEMNRVMKMVNISRALRIYWKKHGVHEIVNVELNGDALCVYHTYTPGEKLAETTIQFETLCQRPH
jgi:hypothetical protein